MKYIHIYLASINTLFVLTSYCLGIDTVNNLTKSEEGRSADTGCRTSNECLHGYCDVTFKCVCYTGWTGLRCELSNQTGNSSSSSGPKSHVQGEAILKTQGNLTTSHQKLSKLLEILLRGSKNKLFDVSTSKYRDVRLVQTTEEDSSDHDVCSTSYKPHKLKDRNCIAGLACQYGTCSKQDQGSSLTFTCQCDKGASGLFCDSKCCLNCGKQGRCEVFSNGTEFCNCKLGFTGQFCDIEIPVLSNLHTGHPVKKKSSD